MKKFSDRKVPSKKQLFDYNFIYRPKIDPFYLLKEGNYSSELEKFYEELDSITIFIKDIFDLSSPDGLKLAINFLQEYQDVIKWYLFYAWDLEFFIEKFKEQSIPIKFKIEGVLYEFGTSRTRAFISKCISIFSLKLIKRYYFYYEDCTDSQSK